MSQVDIANYIPTAKLVLQEFLSLYYDGQTHAVGASGGGPAIEFPSATITYERQQLPEEMLLPEINFSTFPGAKDDQVFAGKTQASIIRETLWKVLIITKDANKNWRSNDLVSSRLGFLCTFARVDLAAKGLKIITVGQPQPLGDPVYQISQRFIKTRFLASYPVN